MDIDYQKLGAKIRKIRMENQLSQEELAEKCNISTSFLGHIERGTRKMSLETLLAVAAALGTGTDQLLFDQLPPTESRDVYKRQAVYRGKKPWPGANKPPSPGKRN